MKAVRWDDKTLGMRVIESEIPAALAAQATRLSRKAGRSGGRRRRAVARRSSSSSGELSVDEIRAGLRARCLAGDIVPVLCGSAFRNKGVQAVLDAVVFYLPSPSRSRRRQRRVAAAASEGARDPSDKAPFAAFAFKIATDAAAGSLTFFRVYSGVLRSGRHRPRPRTRQDGDRRSARADARQRALGDRGSSRRRHRRGRRAQGRHDGR